MKMTHYHEKPFNKKSRINAALIVLFALLNLCHSSDSLRLAKENAHSKQKCFKNLTTSQVNNPQESQSVVSKKCITLAQPVCMGLRLPYNTIFIPDHLPDLNLKTFDEVNAYIERWNGARKLPRCWPNIQVALCSLLMPQCDEDSITGRASGIIRPSVDICNDLVNREECKYIERQLEGWPSLFNCSDSLLYARNCSNDLRDLKYSGGNSQPICQYPLVATNDDETQFKDIGGCSMHCKFPITSPSDLTNISLLVKTLSLVGLITTALALYIYRISKRPDADNSSRLTKVLKRCTVCQFIFYIGWSLQVFYNSDIACSPSGASLYGLPLVANSCVLSFILTYMPSLSTRFWCAHFGRLYLEQILSKDNKPPGNAEIERTLSLFNYGIPLGLFVSVAFLGHIDGHGFYGICTVGQQSVIIKTIFLFAPTAIATIYGSYFFTRIIKLALVENSKMEQMTRPILIRISAIASVNIIQTIFTTVNYLYETENREKWIKSIDEHISCQMSLGSVDPSASRVDLASSQECKLSAQPIATFYYIEIISTLMLGTIIASWTFQDSYFRFLRRKLVNMLEDKEQRAARNTIYGNDLFYRLTNRIPLKEDTEANYPNSQIDPNDENLDGKDGDGYRTVGNNRSKGAFSIETPTSLGSIALPFMNSENSSMIHGNSGHTIRSKNKYNWQTKGSRPRDIVNECKQRNNQANIATSTLDQAQPLLQLMQVLSQSFNPPDWQNLPEAQQFHFNHGVCSYDYGAEEPDNKSQVQDN